MRILDPVLSRRFLITLPLLASLSSALRADGGIFKTLDRTLYGPLTEEEQVAVIAHVENRELLVVAVNFPLEEDESALWVLPVFGPPQEVNVQFIDRFPIPSGFNPTSYVRHRLVHLCFAGSATQIYPVLFWPTVFAGREGLVRIHKVVEKWGIRTEVIQATSLDGLVEHLQNKSVKIERDNLASFAPYCTREYTIVLTWVKSWMELLKEFSQYENRSFQRSRFPCLSIEFPSPRPYYPLKPTSMYGDTEVSVRLVVTGYQKVAKAPELDYLAVDHYYARDFLVEPPQEIGPWFPKGAFHYTMVEIYEPASRFTEDLFFERTAVPSEVRHAVNALWFTEGFGALFTWVLLNGVMSYAMAGLCGLVFFGRWRGIALLGLWNLLTIAAFALAFKYKAASLGVADRSRLGFFVVFSILYSAWSLCGAFIASGHFSI